jgi:hypothetical protein
MAAHSWFWWGNLRERDHFGDPDVDRRIVLRWIFRKRDVEAWTGSSWQRIETSNKPSGSIKCGKFLD